eukprot:Blabericola_migrator_1__8511@NODE_4443_length_1156_cov_35_503214_g2750_i0_p1_GENE_NODE_4443_length_1156_cov_35_503214_g2750_i0NODE_4443_length_1156_cov_35_503214_g2750_i0_p1_ORF_typecomplete_len145_score32_30_NODE_4443_length_1156_cov_35_503214_g2750_i0206640
MTGPLLILPHLCVRLFVRRKENSHTHTRILSKDTTPSLSFVSLLPSNPHVNMRGVQCFIAMMVATAEIPVPNPIFDLVQPINQVFKQVTNNDLFSKLSTPNFLPDSDNSGQQQSSSLLDMVAPLTNVGNTITDILNPIFGQVRA